MESARLLGLLKHIASKEAETQGLTLSRLDSPEKLEAHRGLWQIVFNLQARLVPHLLPTSFELNI